MDPFRRVKPGDKKVSAAAFNLAVDAAQDWQNKRNSQTANGSQDTPQPFVYVKNSSGAACERFDVLGISNELISPADNLNEFKGKLAFIGVTPDEDDHLGKFVLLLEPLANGSIGRGVVNGAVQVRLLVQAGDEDLRFADIASDKTGHLVASASGSATILANTGVSVYGDESSSEDYPVWAVVRLGGGGGGSQIYPGILETAITPASDPATGATTASVRLLVRDPNNPGDLMEGELVTGVNRSLYTTAPDGTFVQVAKDSNGEWAFVWVDCASEGSSS